MLKHVGAEIWNVLIKIHYFLGHLLVFLQTVLQDAWFNHQDQDVTHLSNFIEKNISENDICIIQNKHKFKFY
jgi:hypothetical protein